MRSKLQKFAAFANALLPHEVDYLLSTERFDDAERRRVLEQVSENCRKITGHAAFDEAIDKRKYSYLKTWIEERLEAIDVDFQYEWLCTLELRVMTDSIRPDEEKRLLRLFAAGDATEFNFLKLYDLGRIYRHFLHVRMRYADHRTLTSFLEKHRTSYEYARLVNDKLHQATDDIIAQYARGDTDSMRWEHWLSSVFYENSLDGYNRVLALIRLIFIAYNYRRFDLLPDKLDYLEDLFRQGKFYSKRILLNFYSQRLLAQARAQQFERAEYYGYLSVRARNSDFLYYTNNLAAMLLRNRKPAEALRVLRAALPEARESSNFHNKIGHAAYLARAFSQLGQHRQAVTHAQTFFEAYKKEVLEQRWHLFFSAWLEGMLGQREYAKMLKLAQTHELEQRDQAIRSNPNYAPTIPWLLAMARHGAGKLSAKQLTAYFLGELEAAQSATLQDLVELASTAVPEVMAEVAGRMQKKGVVLRI